MKHNTTRSAFLPTPAQRRFIAALRHQPGETDTAWLCKAAGVSPSSYRRWRRDPAFNVACDALAAHAGRAAAAGGFRNWSRRCRDWLAEARWVLRDAVGARKIR